MSDLTLYYKETINLVKDEYTYIFLEQRDKTLVGRSLRTGETFKFKAEDMKKLNNVTLGFVNTVLGAFPTTRVPARTAKEGISRDSISCGSTGIPAWLPTAFPKEFIAMLENKYPTLEKAVRIAENEKITVAFCNASAVNANGEVFDVLSRTVGTVKGNSIQFINELKRKKYVE